MSGSATRAVEVPLIRRSRLDAIDVVEAAYRVQPSLEAWSRHLVAVTHAYCAGDMGMTCATFELGRGPKPIFTSFAYTDDLPEAQRPIFLRGAEHLSQAEVALFFDHETPAIHSAHRTLMCGLGLRIDESRSFDALRALGIRDFLAAGAVDVSGHGYALAAPLGRDCDVDGPTLRRWRALRAHLLAGLRLHTRVPTRDAVLSPAGKVLHAERSARASRARRALRDAAERIDRARSHPGRMDPEQSLVLWQGLVDGRWSLVDRFDSDGRRYIVAYRNDPTLTRPRELTTRERRVAAYAALGRSNKEIAYELGVAPSTVSTHIAAALRKLRLENRTELARLAALAPRPETEPPPRGEDPAGFSRMGGDGTLDNRGAEEP